MRVHLNTLMQNIAKYNIVDKIMFLLFAIIIFSYTRSMSFTSDEGDNMVGAMHVANGLDIYKHYFSQHTPFPYYLFGIYYFIGISTIADLKLAWGITIFIFILFVYYRYKSVIGRFTLVLMFSYFLHSAIICFGTALMADVIEGMALLVLTLEFIKYYDHPLVKISNLSIGLISASIFIAITSAFVSLYPIFVVILSFLIIDAAHTIRETSFKGIKYYLKLIGIIITPFLCLIIWYSLTNNLFNAYDQSYKFNCDIYSKYNGGLGSNWKDVFINMPHILYLSIKNLFTTFNYQDTTNYNLFFFTLGFFLLCFLRPTLALFFFFYYSYLCIRGIAGFHSIKCYLISPLIFGLACQYFVNLVQKNAQNNLALAFLSKKKFISALSGGFLILGMVSFYFYKTVLETNETLSRSYDAVRNFRQPLWVGPDDNLIRDLVKKDELIWQGSIDSYLYVRTKRFSASQVTALMPWIYESYEKVLLSDLKNNRPVLIKYNPRGNVWGYINSDYAINLNKFLNKNYILIKDELYYRKDLLYRLKTHEKHYGLYINTFQHTAIGETPEKPAGELIANKTVTQSFLAEYNNLAAISVMMATYGRNNNSKIKFTLSADDKSIIATHEIEASKIIDNAFYYFTIPVIHLSKGKTYHLMINSIDAQPGNALTVWLTDKNHYAHGILMDNDKQILGDLVMKIHYS